MVSSFFGLIGPYGLTPLTHRPRWPPRAAELLQRQRPDRAGAHRAAAQERPPAFLYWILHVPLLSHLPRASTLVAARDEGRDLSSGYVRVATWWSPRRKHLDVEGDEGEANPPQP